MLSMPHQGRTVFNQVSSLKLKLHNFCLITGLTKMRATWSLLAAVSIKTA